MEKRRGTIKPFFVDNRLDWIVATHESCWKYGNSYTIGDSCKLFILGQNTNKRHVMWSISCMMLPQKPGETLSERRNQDKYEEEMMSNEVGKI